MWLLWISCLGPTPAAPTDPPAPIVPAAASVAVTRLTGVARNAKLSAVVESDAGHVYLLDRPSWPPDVVGTSVTVEGVVEVTDEFAAQEGPNGEVSQGTRGGDRVMRKSVVVHP